MIHLHGMIVSSLLPGRTFNFMSEMPKLPSIHLQERRIQGKLCKLMFSLTSFPFKSLLLLRCRARVHAFLVLSTQQALSQCLWRKEESKSVYFQFKIYLLFSRTYNGEGNGTPPQCSCLENPMDGGARQAAVHGVAEGRTRLSDLFSLFTFMHWRRKWQHTPVFLPGESQGWRSLVGCRLWGRTESDTTEVTQQQQDD